MDQDGLAAHVPEVATLLHEGGLVVLRTDTLYGVVARADDAAAVEKLQRARQREPGKAFIILIPNTAAAYGDDGKKVAEAYGMADPTHPTSIIVENSAAPAHLLHRDGSVAYRIPRAEHIQELLAQIGPLVAPSANLAGKTPARSTEEARAYFGDEVALYVDDGETPRDQQPSSVIKVDEKGDITQLR